MSDMSRRFKEDIVPAGLDLKRELWSGVRCCQCSGSNSSCFRQARLELASYVAGLGKEDVWLRLLDASACRTLIQLDTIFQNIPRQQSCCCLGPVQSKATGNCKIQLFLEHKESPVSTLCWLIWLYEWRWKSPKGLHPSCRENSWKTACNKWMNHWFWCTSERIQTSEPVALAYFDISWDRNSMRMTWSDE